MAVCFFALVKPKGLPQLSRALHSAPPPPCRAQAAMRTIAMMISLLASRAPSSAPSSFRARTLLSRADARETHLLLRR